MHVARDRHRQVREFGPDEVAHHPFVHRVAVGVQEADRERLDPVLHQLAHLAAHRAWVDRLQHGAVAAHPFADLAAVAPGGEGFGEGQEEVVDVVALLGAHFEDVAESAGGQQPEPGPRFAR